MTDQKGNRLPYIASAASAVIFGFSFLFTKAALDNLDMFQLLGSRFLVAAVLMSVLKTLKLIEIKITPAKVRSLLLVAIFQPVLYFIFETIGVDLTSASESGVLIALIPVAVAVFASPMLKERLSLLQWLSIFASVGGVILITLPRFQAGSGQFAGILALLGAVLAGALYQIFSRKASSRSSDPSTPVEVTYLMMWAGAVFFNILGILRYAQAANLSCYFAAFTSVETLTAILYLGILSSVAAFFCMNYALSYLTASKSAVFINLTPVVSVLAGVLFRDERFAPIQILGAAIVLLGVWGVGRPASSEGKSPASH
ncbi:MAG: DMT family transporter [Firmicutes bacterium]|nr:DMT family transporter [Bacillota bacterium]